MTEKTMELEKQEVETQVTEEPVPQRRTFVPRVNIYEAGDVVVIEADMPGVGQDSVDITLEKNILTIRGEVEMSSPDGYEAAYAEYRIGDYERKFALSDEVDLDKIDATMKNGVLRLTLEKAEEAKARKIVVNSEI